jgi:hypothetical protein
VQTLTIFPFTYHPLRLRLLNAVAARRIDWHSDGTSHTAGWSAGTYVTDGATLSGRRGFLRDPHQIRQLDVMRAGGLIRYRPWRGRYRDLGGALLLSPAGAELRDRWLRAHPDVTETAIRTPPWVERRRRDRR